MDYHQPSAYRPISLTCCLGKCMEKIIVTRLYGFVEHHNLLDKEQEGFRRFRGTSQALLCFTQSIVNGFNAKESMLDHPITVVLNVFDTLKIMGQKFISL